jgi:hypothetical protein
MASLNILNEKLKQSPSGLSTRAWTLKMNAFGSAFIGHAVLCVAKIRRNALALVFKMREAFVDIMT